MRGYFSQLARRTGISFSTEGASGSFSAQGQTGVVRTGSEPKALHGDEVVFTSQRLAASVPAPRAPEPKVETSIEQFPHRHDDHQVAASIEAQAVAANHPDYEPHLPLRLSSNPGEPGPGESFVSETASRELPQRSSEPPGEIPPHEVVIFEDPPEVSQISKELLTDSTLSEVRSAAREIHSPTSTELATKLAAIEVEPRERLSTGDETVLKETHVRPEMQAGPRSYLQEVIDWVSTPFGPDENEIDFASAEPSTKSGEVGSRADAQQTSPSIQTAGDHESETQLLNLSVGTISIVIEEPQKEPNVATVIPARAERAPDQQARPTDLSRYYIRRW